LTVGIAFATPSQAFAPTNFKEYLSPRAYAALQVKHIWRDNRQYACLSALWDRESHWNPKSQNRVKVSGLRAGGIPQILGLSPKLRPHTQIDRGLKYIMHRYQTPCNAWAFWLNQDRKGGGWY